MLRPWPLVDPDDDTLDQFVVWHYRYVSRSAICEAATTMMATLDRLIDLSNRAPLAAAALGHAYRASSPVL